MGNKSDVHVCAIIPARGGSKGVKNKNIRLVNKKPLISYSIAAATSCPEIDICVVSTDSCKIADIASNYDVDVILRPAKLARDTSRSEDVVTHVLDALAQKSCFPDQVILLQPTSPLRTSQHISEALALYKSANAKSCISVTESEHHPYKCFIEEGGSIKPLRDVQSLSMPRQILPKVFRQNGAIYVVDVIAFRKANSFYIEPAVYYKMSGDVSLDIDSEADLDLAVSSLKTNGI